MVETVEVLVVIDNTNKIYYTEDKNFLANNRNAINLAWREYFNLVLEAQKNGYQIIKREKSLNPMDEGVMSEIDERIGELGGRPR